MNRFIAQTLAASQVRINEVVEWWKNKDRPFTLALGAAALGAGLSYLGAELFIPGGYENTQNFIGDKMQAVAGFVLEQVGILPPVPETQIVDPALTASTTPATLL